ncbi:MAG: hypothetical protein HYW14_01145 [Planctomycetes bacterium]|nr:hypothetical protein [Planctomycetota bacterium]
MREGFKTILKFLEDNVAFEVEQERLYNKFALAAQNTSVQTLFNNLSRSARGHRDAIDKLIKNIAQDDHNVILYCTLCGWGVDFGKSPFVGNEERCPVCCQKFALVETDGDFSLKPLPQ